VPDFSYRARNRMGQTHRGRVTASSEAAVARRLEEMGFFPVEIHPAPAVFTRPVWDRPRIPVSEIVVFHRQLAAMYAAGLPFTYSLATLAEGTANRALRRIIEAVRSEVEGGGTFSDALSRHPDVFDEITVNMVRVGETTGHLAEILERLADYGEKSAETRSRVKNALAYPVILSAVALGVVVFAMVVVMPRFAAIFTKIKAPLPWPTKVLMAGSYAATRHGWLALALLAMAGIAFYIFLRTAAGRWWWDGVRFRLPLLGPLRVKNLSARFARNLGTLVESGVDILYSFEVCAQTLGSVRMERALLATRESVREGESISPMLERQKVFPPLLPRMVAVGEETGKLGEMLARVAKYYELEVEMTVKRLTALLEPLMILLMGGVVAFVAAATLLPLFNMVKYVR
jgi:type IV pilus assembly protein PilC